MPDAAAEPAQHSHPSCHVSPAWHSLPLAPLPLLLRGRTAPPSSLPARRAQRQSSGPKLQPLGSVSTLRGCPPGSIPLDLEVFQASAPPLELLTLGNCGAAYVDFSLVWGLFGFFWFFFFGNVFTWVKKKVTGNEGQMMLCLLPGFLSLGWRISRIRNEETLPRVAQSSATTLPGDRGKLWAGPGHGAEQRLGFACFAF